MTSLAGQPLLVPILPPAPHEPVAQAVVLRLSESSLDALRELVRSGLLEKPGGSPTVELELNDAGPSALHIINASAPFPLSSTTFSPPLELLSRRAQVASAPLHLAALAQTRYAVRHTDVSQSAKERLREGKEKEEREKRGRKIVQLDGEPSRAVTKGKGRATSAATLGLGSRSGTPIGRSSSTSGKTGAERLQPPSQQGTISHSSGSRQASRSPAPPVSRETSRPGSTLRTRILQLLALGPLSSKQIISKVRANESEVSRILSEIARPTSINANMHRLLPQSYLQLDIFTWKQYSQADKATVIAACEQAFDELRLPRDAEERRMVDPEWKGGSPLKQMLSAAGPVASSSSRTRDGSADSRASLERKKPRREASPRASATRSAVVSPSSDSEGEVAPSSRKRKGSHAEQNGGSLSAKAGSAALKEKRRRTIAPDEAPIAASAAESSKETKPKIHRPPASPLPDLPSAPTPPAASLPSHIRQPETAIASSPAGTPVPHAVPSPPVASRASKLSGSNVKVKARSKRNATPDFTSSEDEPDAQAKDKSDEDDAHADAVSTSTRSPSPPPPPLDLPTSRPALRARFKDLFGRYEALNIKLEKERQASEDLLAGRQQGREGEVNRPWEDLKRDVRQRNAWHRELEEIKRRLA